MLTLTPPLDQRFIVLRQVQVRQSGSGMPRLHGRTYLLGSARGIVRPVRAARHVRERIELACNAVKTGAICFTADFAGQATAFVGLI